MDKPSPDQRATEFEERLTLPCDYDQSTGLIEFWSGATTLSRDEKSRSGIGKILFELAPKPGVIFEFESNEIPNQAEIHNVFNNTEEAGIYEMSCGEPVGAMSVNVTGINKNKTGSFFSGPVVDQIDPDPLFDSIKYLVINGPGLHGKFIQGNNSIYKGRTETKIDGFEIVIDQIKEKKKNARTPFVFTHVIEVRFNKRSSNPRIDLIGSILHKTLSFMCGRWVGLVGPWGYSETGSLNRVFPQVTMTSMNPPGLSWYYSMVKGTFEELFRCLYYAYNEQKKYEVLTTGIGWYIEAEQSAGLIEGSIVLQQAALETLAWFEVVEQRGLCSVNGFKSLPASDKIRLLLSLYSIPTSLPAKSTELIAYSKEFNLEDLICVLVDVRNALVHGMPKKVEKLLSRLTGSNERVDLWYQINGLLAQAILATAGYQGKIICRSLDVEFIHSAIKDVPWKKSETQKL